MTRSLSVFVLCLILGCGPATPTHRTAKQVGWVALVHEYRDNPKQADAEYFGQTIQVYLPAMSYRTLQGRVETYHGLGNTPGALIFECKNAPEDNKAALLVTGRCTGCVRDGIERANRVKFAIVVSDAQITILGQ